MEKSAAAGTTQVPPYESAPQYGGQPPAAAYAQAPPQPMMHHDSYQINQVPNQQGQYQQSPMGSPPAQIKQETSYYGAQPVQSPPPQQVPQVLAPPPSQYHTSTPLQSLQEGPAPVDCPSCRTRHVTRVTYLSGNTTMAWAAVICFVFCLGCIPFMMRSLKDVEHSCGHCGTKLATWHNSGRTVVHAHG